MHNISFVWQLHKVLLFPFQSIMTHSSPHAVWKATHIFFNSLGRHFTWLFLGYLYDTISLLHCLNLYVFCLTYLMQKSSFPFEFLACNILIPNSLNYILDLTNFAKVPCWFLRDLSKIKILVLNICKVFSYAFQTEVYLLLFAPLLDWYKFLNLILQKK